MHRLNSNLFQIYLSDKQLDLPESLKGVQAKFQKLFIEYDYHYYNLETLRGFVFQNFSSQVLAAYDSLRPYAYKSDLGRYCLLYKYGGWYADISLKPLLQLSVTENTQLIYFYDHGEGPCEASHSCQNGFFYVKNGHPLLKDCINQIIKNCKNKYYGYSPLIPTGPAMFGEKLARYMPAPGVHKGYFMQLTPFHRFKNRAYIAPDGEIVALHKTAWWSPSLQGSLEEFGAIGTNSYLEMWSNKNVYLDHLGH